MNLHFVIEGEEEIGSGNLGNFLSQNREALKCDVVVVSDTGMIARGVPTLGYGLRGITALEVKVIGPKIDLHSGVFGGAVANPVTALARLLATLHDSDGHVAIPGFYEQVKPLEDWEREAWKKLPIDADKEILKETGSPSLFGEAGYSTLERLWGRPTAEINGIGGGYQGMGTKTVIASHAMAKLTFRLVPNQTGRRNSGVGQAAFAQESAAGRYARADRRSQRSVVFDRSAFGAKPGRATRFAQSFQCGRRGHSRRRQHPDRLRVPKYSRRRDASARTGFAGLPGPFAERKFSAGESRRGHPNE